MRLGRTRSRPTASKRKVPWWGLATYAVFALGIGAVVAWVLWPTDLDSVVEQTKAENQAVRTGLAAAGVAGAAFTVWLAFWRQHTTEHDATERRVTELYTAAVEQLGHEHAAVRLGGLYALQRLGQDHPDQRRAIVNVWCAYLRMPFADPDDAELDDPTRRQELRVRTTVQDLLREHAHPHHDVCTDDPRYWGDQLTLGLTGATLHHLDLSGRRIHPHIHLTQAHFTGPAWFRKTTFTGEV